MTVTAPPRPPRPGDPVDRDELEALVEALIEEARQRARRRRRIYGAVAALVALVGVTVFAVFERSAQSQTASPALAARSGLPAGTTSSKLAFVGPCTPRAVAVAPIALYVMNADGSGKRRLARDAFTGSAWSPDGQKIAFERDHHRKFVPGAYTPADSNIEIYVINADGSGERRLTRNPAVDQGSYLVARRAEDRLQPGRLQPRRRAARPDLRHERRRKRTAEADPDPGAQLGSRLVARREDRLRELPRTRRLRCLRHERRRQRTAEPDPRVGARRLSGLVARRAEDRLHEQARRRLGALRPERRRDRAAEADAQRRPRMALLPGRPTGGRSPSAATAPAATTRSTSSTPTAAGYGG